MASVSTQCNHPALIQQWRRLAAVSIAASLGFGLTACGDSNALSMDTAATAQSEKSPGSDPMALSTESGNADVATEAPVTSTPGAPAPAPSAPAPAPAPSPAPPVVKFSGLRVLPLGDSMTAGNEADPSSYRSYRGPLYRMLISAGHDVDFVGTLSQTPALGGDPNHDGYGGAQIGPGGGANNLTDRVRAILGSVGEVDVIVLAFGWNSAYQEPAYAATKYEGLVRLISGLRPNATLVLGTLSPQRAETEQQTTSQLTGYRDLNAKARELANASTTDKLILADLAKAGFKGEDYWDVIHWLQSGADRAARVISDSMTANASIITR